LSQGLVDLERVHLCHYHLLVDDDSLILSPGVSVDHMLKSRASVDVMLVAFSPVDLFDSSQLG